MKVPIEVIVNAGSGNGTDDETSNLLKNEFAAVGVEIVIHVAKNGDEIESLAKDAADGDAEIIVAGGGDGTISAVAAVMVNSGKTLGVLPLGTLNNFSKDLEIPQDLTEVVRVIAEGEVKTIDVAEVNGRIFINNSSIGLYPRIVANREKQERLGRGKWHSAFWASMRMFKLSPFLKVRMMVDEKIIVRKTPFVFVGNNESDVDLYNIGRRASLDKGKLSVYFLRRDGRWGVFVMLFRTMFGRLKQWRDFEVIITDAISIKTRRKWLQVAMDGEVNVMETPLEYKIVPKALKVIVPSDFGF